jgi:hypothetical protein
MSNEPSPCTQPSLCTLLISPKPEIAITRTLSHQDCMYAKVCCSKRYMDTASAVTYLHLGSPHIKVPFLHAPCHAMQSRSQLREGAALRRDKGLGKACCEAPVGQTTDVDATGADAATSLNALADCSLVGFSFLTTHTHKRTSLNERLIDCWRGVPRD